MDIEQIIARVDEILVREFELEADDIVPEATLREDLDLDSLDAVDLVVALEKEFEFRVSNEVLKDTRTVGDIHDFVRRLWAEKLAAAEGGPGEDDAAEEASA